MGAIVAMETAKIRFVGTRRMNPRGQCLVGFLEDFVDFLLGNGLFDWGGALVFGWTICIDRLVSQWRSLEVAGYVRFHSGRGGDLFDRGGSVVLGWTICMWVGFLVRILFAAVV